VHDGLQAVEEAAAFRPDLVLLDIGMPRLNGYDAARRIRAERWGKSPLIVAMTGWGQDEDKRRAAAAGFDRHFTKPVDPGDIKKLIAGMRANAPQRTLATGD
jgi:CheY-like chemotaxis protein